MPLLERATFSNLMSAKLRYEKSRGFRIDESTDLYRVRSTLEKGLGEDIKFASRCFICEEKVGSTDGTHPKYDLRKFSHSSLCEKCLGKDDVFTLYAMRFAELTE